MMTGLFKCSILDCPYSGNFRSRYELRRHTENQHIKSQRKRRFGCCAHGCLGRQRPPRFARADKLTAHIRAVHDAATTFACPNNGCPRVAFNTLEFFVHTQSHVDSRDVECEALLKAVANGVSPTFFHCPIWHCKKSVPLHHAIDHLLDHGEYEIRSIWKRLDQMDYIYAPSVDDASHMVDPCWTAPFMRIFIICPICNLKCPNHADFEFHLVDKHAQRDSHHFSLWIAHIENTLIRQGYTALNESLTVREHLRKAVVWKAWRFALMNSHTVDFELRCPVCKVTEKIEGDTTATHHLSLLSNHSNLVNHRWKVLSLYPGFASHPVFKDVQTSGQATEPHIFRLRQTCSMMVNGSSSPLGYSDCPRTNSTSWPMHTIIDMPQDPAHNAIAGQARLEVPPDTCSSLEIRPADPMVGGCDETATCADENDGTSIYKGASSPVTNGRADDFENSVYLPTTRKCHTYRKRFVCDHERCSLRFERRSELNQHQRAHRRPYTCDSCGKTFAYAKDQRRHAKIHLRSIRARSDTSENEPRIRGV